MTISRRGDFGLTDAYLFSFALIAVSILFISYYWRTLSTLKQTLRMASVVKDDDLRSFDVPEITRHASGYTIYKIILQVTPKEITENSYQLVYWKRYSDIRKLYDTLHRYHQAIYRPGKFPDFPEKSGYMERFNAAVIETRRIATKQFLNFAIQHLYLRTHDAYINFFQKGDKVLLPDVKADTLEPQSVIPKPSHITIPDLPTPVQSVTTEEKKDELLFNVDEEVSHVNNTSARILDDLNDLKFEQDEMNANPTEPLDLLSQPLTTAADSNDAS